MVEVVSPEGTKELWAVAARHDEAVAIVRSHIARDHTAQLTNQRPPISLQMQGLSYGEARRVKP
jgi:hypothetical protein